MRYSKRIKKYSKKIKKYSKKIKKYSKKIKKYSKKITKKFKKQKINFGGDDSSVLIDKNDIIQLKLLEYSLINLKDIIIDTDSINNSLNLKLKVVIKKIKNLKIIYEPLKKYVDEILIETDNKKILLQNLNNLIPKYQNILINHHIDIYDTMKQVEFQIEYIKHRDDYNFKLFQLYCSDPKLDKVKEENIKKEICGILKILKNEDYKDEYYMEDKKNSKILKKGSFYCSNDIPKTNLFYKKTNLSCEIKNYQQKQELSTKIFNNYQTFIELLNLETNKEIKITELIKNLNENVNSHKIFQTIEYTIPKIEILIKISNNIENLYNNLFNTTTQDSDISKTIEEINLNLNQLTLKQVTNTPTEVIKDMSLDEKFTLALNNARELDIELYNALNNAIKKYRNYIGKAWEGVIPKRY